MDHGAPHHGMPMPMPGGGHSQAHRCAMDMTWNWNSQNVCVVFQWWAINGVWQLILSVMGVAAIALFHEWFRRFNQIRERKLAVRLEREARDIDRAEDVEAATLSREAVPLVGLARRKRAVSNQDQLLRALLYAVQVMVSYFLMLVIMTYNGFLVLGAIIGATAGFFIFETDVPTEYPSLVCH